MGRIRFLKILCAIGFLVVLASNVWSISRWDESRGVYDDICYLRQAHLFERFGLRGIDTNITVDGVDFSNAFFGGVTEEEIEAGRAQMADATAEWMTPSREDRHDLLITHNFVIGWFVRESFGAADWRWLGINQANCGLTIIRVRSAKPPVLVAHNDLGHLPPELRTGLPVEQPY